MTIVSVVTPMLRVFTMFGQACRFADALMDLVVTEKTAVVIDNTIFVILRLC